MKNCSFGLALIVVKAIYKAVSRVRELGMTALIVEQDVLSALEQAARGYVLDVGHITMTGFAQELLNDPRVKEAYLGL